MHLLIKISKQSILAPTAKIQPWWASPQTPGRYIQLQVAPMWHRLYSNHWSITDTYMTPVNWHLHDTYVMTPMWLLPLAPVWHLFAIVFCKKTKGPIIIYWRTSVRYCIISLHSIKERSGGWHQFFDNWIMSFWGYWSEEHFPMPDNRLCVR